MRDGLPYTDHLMIRPGALHLANGGFIILQAADLLSQSRSWDAVKRMLALRHDHRRECQRVTGIAPERLTTSATDTGRGEGQYSLEIPRPTRLLVSRDSEFHHLFKVRADFDSEMPRNDQTERFYGYFAGDVARASQSPPLTDQAVALLVEEGSRWVEDQERLSTQLGSLCDLTVEACYWAKKEHSPLTDRVHVEKAIASRQRRLSLLSDKLDQMIYQGTTMIDTAEWLSAR